MGNSSSVTSFAYRDDYEALMLDHFSKGEIPEDATVLVVRLVRASHLDEGNPVTQLSDPYIEVKLDNDQLQRSTVKPATLNPHYVSSSFYLGCMV